MPLTVLEACKGCIYDYKISCLNGATLKPRYAALVLVCCPMYEATKRFIVSPILA